MHHKGMGHRCAKFFIAFILFVLLSPGLLLTLPAGNKGYFNSMQTSLPAILLHGLIFAILYGCISHMYWAAVKHWKARQMMLAIASYEQQRQGAQLDDIVMMQAAQTRALYEIGSNCKNKTVVQTACPYKTAPPQIKTIASQMRNF